MVTMQDVADCAGVSKATVSRVLNGKNVVGDALKARVNRAIEETGYRPNLLARQMATQKTSFIGVVMSSTLYDGPYFAAMMSGAASFINQHNRQLIFADSKFSVREEREAIDFLIRLRCEGVVVYPEYLSEQELDDMIESSPVPLFILNRRLERHPRNGIWIDHYHAASEMMDFLIAQGHRRIAFISGKTDSWSNRNRQAAWHDALERHGISYSTTWVAHGDWSLESGYQAMRTLLDSAISVSAILAANDDMALGAIKALMQAAISVPGDISVAGFDNARIGNYVTPSLTTMEIPVVDMVHQAIGRILNNDSTNDREIVGKLILRESVRAV